MSPSVDPTARNPVFFFAAQITKHVIVASRGKFPVRMMREDNFDELFCLHGLKYRSSVKPESSKKSAVLCLVVWCYKGILTYVTNAATICCFVLPRLGDTDHYEATFVNIGARCDQRSICHGR